MTGYTVHTGSTVKFSESWDTIFGGGGTKKAAAKPAAAKKTSAARKLAAGKKSAAKKSAAKKATAKGRKKA